MKEKLLALLGGVACGDEVIVDVVLSMAVNAVLDYISRETLPKRLQDVAVRLAVIYYNRIGNEGETARTEGGISQSFNTDIPDDIIRQLKNYPKKVGVINAIDET